MAYTQNMTEGRPFPIIFRYFIPIPAMRNANLYIPIILAVISLTLFYNCCAEVT